MNEEGSKRWDMGVAVVERQMSRLYGGGDEYGVEWMGRRQQIDRPTDKRQSCKRR